MWSMDDWQYISRDVVTDAKGNRCTIALMDVLGQEGDPDMPNKLAELQYSSRRYFTRIYFSTGALQRERGYGEFTEAKTAYEELLIAVMDGTTDPSQPVFRENLD